MLLEKVKNTIKRYNLVKKRERIVVGVSGGPDSVALLYLLNSLREELKISLHIAHLDHMLRRSSCKERRFVQNLADKLKIPITSAAINVKKLAKRGSLEEIARNARLGFFFRVAKEVKARKVALGHNLDDQAETVLMRILRGSGLYGLSGILPKRNIAGYSIIRPLIEVRRKEIESFLKKKKINPCLDASNREDIYLRNKIRNRLLPLLEKEYNKNIREILSNMAQSIGYDYEYLNRIIQRKVRHFKAQLLIKRLIKTHPAIRRLILRAVIARLKGDTRKIAFVHIKEIEDLILNRPVNSVVDLPKGLSALKKRKYLVFFQR